MIGKRFKSNSCGYFTVVEEMETSKKDRMYVCEFEDGYKKSALKGNILKGKVKNPYHKSIMNVACIGSVKKNDNRILYQRWHAMIKRVFSKYESYENVRVCKRWLCFENFVADCKRMEGYNELDLKNLHIDKDIIGDGSLYSFETCCFVPAEVNVFMATNSKYNKSGFVGVCKYDSGKYRATIRIKGKQKHLGLFDDPDVAHEVYRKHKLQQAKRFKSVLSDSIYKSLIYKIERM